MGSVVVLKFGKGLRSLGVWRPEVSKLPISPIVVSTSVWGSYLES